MTKLLEILDGLKDGTLIEDSDDPEILDLRDVDKLRHVQELKMQGIPVTTLAKLFKVSVSTIYNWLNKNTENFRNRLEQLSRADIISEHLQWLQTLEEMLLYEATQVASSGEVEIDPKTGLVKKDERLSVSMRLLKLRFLNAARNTRQTQIDLMKDTGVLPKAPEHIYHTMSQEKKTVDESGSVGDVRTPEQIKENITKLITYKRQLVQE